MPESDVLRIANCSGFYGDRLSAAKEMVEGGPLRVLAGDYLAELTMAILFKSRLKKPETGYATTFLAQMEQVMATCLDRGIRVVANAGGLNPPGLAPAPGGACRSRTSRRPWSPPMPISAAGASPRRSRGAPTSSSPDGSLTPRWRWGRRRGG